MDVEAKVIAFLSGRGWDAYADVPSDRPGEFVVVERTGGRRRYRTIDEPMLTVQCWSTTRAKASDMAYRVARDAEMLIEVPGVNSVAVESVYNYPDLDSGTPRYQMTLSLVTVGN